MSSPMLQKLPAPETAAAIVSAVGTVAERSFFAFVDLCDEPFLAEVAADWLVGTVHFEEGPVAGSMSCTLPADLAQSLFDAFSGRDPSSRLPTEDQLDDLVGEFSNIVCGTWLTRYAGDRAFRLEPPVVARVRQPAAADGGRLWVTVNNRPLAVDLDLASVPPGGAA